MSERRSRGVSLVLSLLFLGIFLSANFPWYGRNSAFDELGDQLKGSVIALLHFGIPLVAAVITFSRRMRGRTPQRASFWMMILPEVLKGVAVLLALISLGSQLSYKGVFFASLGLLLLFGALFTVLQRSKSYEGWGLWASLLAAMVPWHAFVAGMLLLGQRYSLGLLGLRIYLLLVAASLPVAGWVLWPRSSLKVPA